jgi:hypothetical protein
MDTTMPVASEDPEDPTRPLSTTTKSSNATSFHPTEASKEIVPREESGDGTPSALVSTENASTNAGHPPNADIANRDVRPVQASTSEVGNDDLGVDSNVSALVCQCPSFRGRPGVRTDRTTHDS